ncbi:MAG: putative DNA-binding domain-containing protein, partial [Variovorax paradoxus]
MNAPRDQFQQAFAQALFAPPEAAPPAVRVLAMQPAFAVYRNTVMKACIDALQANFPTVAQLVGEEWFRAAAALYVAADPPSDGRL